MSPSLFTLNINHINLFSALWALPGIGGDHGFAVRTLQEMGLAISVKRGFVFPRQKKGIDQRKGWSECTVNPPPKKGSPLALCDDGGQKTNEYWK